MKGLPDSKVYELELKYWPYKKSWEKVLEYIIQEAPRKGTLLDLMCGPGFLLGKIAEKRPDLKLKGVDVDRRYIEYSRKQYPKIDFELANVLSWRPSNKFDVVICTGSLHHIPYSKQAFALRHFSTMVKKDGFVLISDCYIDDYSNERDRKQAAAKLGYEYLSETIANGAPEEAVEPAIDILWNDVMKKEFKDSIKKRMPFFKEIFSKVENFKTWPNCKSEYGDYITICKLGKK